MLSNLMGRGWVLRAGGHCCSGAVKPDLKQEDGNWQKRTGKKPNGGGYYAQPKKRNLLGQGI